MDILCYVKKARERIANSMLPVLNEKKKRKEDNCITDRQTDRHTHTQHTMISCACRGHSCKGTQGNITPVSSEKRNWKLGTGWKGDSLFTLSWILYHLNT